ncbi:Uncharacterised protein [Mycobacteroides abscessus subsp. abscessus]|uniref:hypothetical protein n=1 Tax=Mycobacteroides abscessus TaxID=36809 RepID=UPI00092C0B7B|nr:hypothetical protein [Mycobacteroides abscessus]MBN7353586.1 hypothetical protein [Mycobacteroides abscessus subsp. abscessus]SHT67774.1 Uncharacterised protein [Mycobacteroides abscessus subsp. abscessus]SHW84887.1 Uncharacterised protein [Mycobacteroides abscessus subsp. abscessus]SHY43273.1 Uncharacterised protein [Mycobacteroides abscessus subsp. abscessus]SIB12911.1 Uncharacterised protein [Mycobacteroides abscessus subsp. abscessus]
MSSEVWAAVIGGVAGLGAGALSSLIAPWVNWGVEQKREKRDHRRALITSWRDGIASIDVEGTDAGGFPDGYQIHFTRRYFSTPWYETLRPHLSEADRANTEKNNQTIGWGTPRSLKNFLADAVDRIEEEWGLRP